MKKKRLHCILAVALAALTACAPLAQVREIKPRLALPPGDCAELRRSEQFIAAAGELEHTNPTAAVGTYLSAVDAAQGRLRAYPGDKAALRDYNYALSRALAVIGKYKIAAWEKPLELPGQGGGYVLSCRKETRELWKPVDYDFIPVDQLSVGGTAFQKKVTCEGLGAPVVAVRREAFANYKKEFLGSNKIFYGVTAIARFEGRRCIISFEDPLAVESVQLDGHHFTLAADYNAGMAMLLAAERPERLGFIRMLIPAKYDYTMRIARLQPYDPKKIPVLFIHGLQDTPATWALMINTLHSDPELRRKYQFWVFSYPSGYPFPYSASILRQNLDEIHRAYPDAKRMVVVGHSMGGLVGRLLVTDSCDKIWRTYFNKPPEEIALPAADKNLLAGALIFRHRPEVERIIFISTPHRGSLIASNWIGRIAAGIIRTPGRFIALTKDTLLLTRQDEAGSIKVKRIPNSIDTLSPNNRFLKILDALPIAKGIPYHSIMGDRGRGGGEKSSDGVVPYWSSHLNGAESELIVPSGHSAHRNPEAIAEVMRILKLDLKTRSSQ